MSIQAVQKSAAAAIVAAFVALAPASSAQAEGGVPSAAAKPKVETLAARISSDGGLIQSKGAVKVALSGASYSVTFNRNVSRCFYTATVAAGGPVVATAQALEGSKKTVLVSLYAASGDPTPYPFYLVVSCFD